MLTARFCRLSVHYSVARLMSPPNIHFGSLKDGVSAVEVFEVEVISEMQRSRFILVAWQLPDKKKKIHRPFSSQDLSKMERKKGGGNVSCLLSFPANSGGKRGQTKASADILTHQGRMWQG